MKTHLKDIVDVRARRKAMLDDLVKNPRGGCASYAGRCAIGRHLPDTLNLKLDILDNSEVWAIAKYLPPWMQEMDWRFLAEVQSLHDQLPYWDPFDGYKRLNDHGLVFADLIRRQWDLL